MSQFDRLEVFLAQLMFFLCSAQRHVYSLDQKLFRLFFSQLLNVALCVRKMTAPRYFLI